jgi:hypothetical protein
MGQINHNSVDFENYSRIYIWIDQQLGRYMINVESWIVASFFELPKTPNELAVRRLDEWVQKYLPRKISDDLWKFIQNTHECMAASSIFMVEKTGNSQVDAGEKR